MVDRWSDARMQRARTAFDESIRAMELQERSIDALRGRATLVATLTLGVAGFAASIVERPNAWWWAAVGGVALTVSLAVASLVGAKWWMTFDAYDLVDDHVDDASRRDKNPGLMWRDLALYLQAYRVDNERKLSVRSQFLNGSFVCLAVTAVLFAASSR